MSALAGICREFDGIRSTFHFEPQNIRTGVEIKFPDNLLYVTSYKATVKVNSLLLAMAEAYGQPVILWSRLISETSLVVIFFALNKLGTTGTYLVVLTGT